MSAGICEHGVLCASCHPHCTPPPLPTGCVLCPLLNILYTDDCRSNQENIYIIKLADDSALLFLLKGTQDGHGAALDVFIDWCDDSYLDLNAGKTKEMTVDFRRQGYAHLAIQIHGEPF